MNRKGLEAAAIALEDLAEGRMPARPLLLQAAAALDAECTARPAWRDLADARFGLRALADGGTMVLDQKGREKAGRLGEVVRSLLDTI